MRASPSLARRGLKLAGVAALAALLGAAPATSRAAAPADPATLEWQLRDWLAGLLGPEVTLGDRPVRFVPEGDHLALSVPVAGVSGPGGVSLAGPPFTARVRRMDDGSWALDDGRLPSPLRIAAPGGRNWAVTLQDQTQRAVLDPTLATASTWDMRVGHYRTESHGPDGERTTEATNLQAHLVLQPAGNGRLDLRETSSSELIASNTRLPRGGVMSFSAGRNEMSTHFDRLRPTQIAPALHATLRLAALLAEGGAAAANGTARMTPALRRALDGLLQVAGDLMDGAGQTGRFENVHVHSAGIDIAMRRLDSGGRIAARDGRLQARLDLAVEGLDAGPTLAGPMRAFLPHRLVLRQHVGGLPAAGVVALLRAAADGAAPADLTGQGAALLRHGPLSVGIDELAADFGPATLTASGTLRVAGPNAMTGQADIRATGLDALIAAARTNAVLRQALPVLIFLKGIGETQGAATLWAIAWQDGRLTVNGTDLSQLVPLR